ncbi:MAG: hypothetical protein JWQ74_1761 [Marmoricola sp.]|nr:hypothetical protein [Marmoricola sp.]
MTVMPVRRRALRSCWVGVVVSNGRVPNDEPSEGIDWIPIYLVSLLLVGFLLVIGAIGHDTNARQATVPRPRPHSTLHLGRLLIPRLPPRLASAASLPAYPKVLPGGATTVFAPNKMLVAYYGTAGTGSLGVLGDASPDRIMPRLTRAAAAFERGGRTVQPVFELIVTVAHAGPTSAGTYSSDISRSAVLQYIEAAHRHGALVVLDLQPGKSDFLTVAKRWAWALADPWVGLALDPEWRMSRGGIPGQRIGSVSASEINGVSRWLENLTVTDGLPQKIFLLHQFRTDMIRHLERVLPRPRLAIVQHVDGYGPPRAKLATFHAVSRPAQFFLGFKLFYRQDVPRMRPAQVFRIRPRVQFVSFQ